MHDRVSSSSPLPNRVDIRTIVPLATLVIETLGLICNRSRSIMTNSPHHMRRRLAKSHLGHLTDQHRRTPRAANFDAQLVAKAPQPKLVEALSAAFKYADILLREGMVPFAARVHEAAIAQALMSMRQLSLHDLASLDVGRHLERDRDGPIRRIRMSGRDASSPVGIDISLSEYTAAHLERHLVWFRPLLPGAERSTPETATMGSCLRPHAPSDCWSDSGWWRLPCPEVAAPASVQDRQPRPRPSNGSVHPRSSRPSSRCGSRACRRVRGK